jgi:nucleotide-binding universal stress UspA family protein
MKFMVAFSSPKRSAKTVEVAAQHAKALGAEVLLLRMVPDPEKVGVVAQLIATGRPEEKARQQVEETATNLKTQGLNARGIVKVGEVSRGIIQVALEENVDLLFVGTQNVAKRPMFLMERDPIVHYLVNHCPIPLFLVRHDDSLAISEPDSE